MPHSPADVPAAPQPTLAELADSLADLAWNLSQAMPDLADDESRAQLERSLTRIHSVSTSLHGIDLLYASEHARQFERHGAGLRRVAQSMSGVVSELSRAAKQVATQLGQHIQELEQIAQMPNGGATNARLQATLAHVHNMAAEMNGTLDTITTRVALASEGVATLEAELRDAREKALVDALTQLHSRSALVEHLAAAIAEGTDRAPWCLLRIAVDELQRTIDTYGQIVGDALLFETARLIEAALPQDEGKAFLARYGAHDFALVLHNADAAEAHAVAKAVRASAQGKRWQRRGGSGSGSGVVHTTLTIGGTTYRHGDTQLALLERTADALRQAHHTDRKHTVIL